MNLCKVADHHLAFWKHPALGELLKRVRAVECELDEVHRSSAGRNRGREDYGWADAEGFGATKIG